MIVDSHNHIFPLLSTAAGHESAEKHLEFLQIYISTHSEPIYRLRDNAIVPEAASVLHDGTFSGPSSLNLDAKFRVGKYGRFEWEFNGETHYRSFLPPSLQDMTTPVEFIVQAMDRASIDCSILQNARLYGRLNTEFAEAMKRYPERFIGLADVYEYRADSDEEIARLRYAITDLGLKGIYYASRGHFENGFRRNLDHPDFDPYWQVVRELKIPVFWEILGVPAPTTENYLRQIDALNRWCDQYPDIPTVLTHGIGADYLTGTVPEPIKELLSREQMMVEILYPIHWGRAHEYPYLDLIPALESLISFTGTDRLVWGSDMPNVERNCTYRQSREYLYHTLKSSASEAGLDGIFGGNVLRLFDGVGLGRTARGTI